MTGGDVVTAAGEPEHLTPPNSNESEGIEVLSALFRQLVENDPVTSEPELVVAESIVTEDGGKTYTITVADGWTFHDGTPVTAQSFVDAWNYTANGANAQANNGFFSGILGYAELNAVEG
jgi:oligopeptide transport system substrate-binding protein